MLHDFRPSSYTSLYSSLFTIDRLSILNVTFLGKPDLDYSVKMWSKYVSPFANTYITLSNDEEFSPTNAQTLLYTNGSMLKSSYILVNETMNVVVYFSKLVGNTIFSSLSSHENALEYAWKFLLPGGYFIFQGINGTSMEFVLDPTKLRQSTRHIFDTNHVFFVGVDIGTESWSKKEKHKTALVIRKRVGPNPPVKINFAKEAMSDLIRPSSPTNVTHPTEFLEDLMFKYGTDKSKDDHGYVNIYSSLFPFHRRHSILNILEVGVSMGQSLQVWHEYFPNATVFGLDVHQPQNVIDNLAVLSRVRYLKANGYDSKAVSSLDLIKNSMDIIIEDGTHRIKDQQRAISVLWPYLKPGGYFIIEDVDAFTGGFHFLQPDRLLPSVVEILKSNIAFFVNCAVGHRAWHTYKRLFARHFNYVAHNSNLVVIRKRVVTNSR